MAVKPIPLKHVKKSDRELKVLFGLVELYLKTGKPVGSHTLKEHGFDDLSSATLRNYFAKLEENAYLKQPHASGGRIPTDLAYQLYAHEYRLENRIEDSVEKRLYAALQVEVKEPATYLSKASDLLSEVTGLASFISSPRFDHDYITDMKFVSLDAYRLVVVTSTQFGLVQTEVLHSDRKLSLLTVKRIEGYCQWRLHGKTGVSPALEPEEESIATSFYHEVIIRYVAKHANFTELDVYKTGFSKLLHFPEFNDPKALAGSLSLFENRESLTHLLQDTMKERELSCFIGRDLIKYSPFLSETSSICIPYLLNQTPVGVIGVLGAMRIPYRRLFAILKVFATYTGEALTKSIYKFKLQYRHPRANGTYLEQDERLFNNQGFPILLEDRRE